MKKFTSETTETAQKAAGELAAEINALGSMDFSQIPAEGTAMVIVDAVNGFIREGAMSSPRIEEIIPNIVELMKKCKAKSIPIAAFADCHGENCAEFESFPPHCVKGTSEAEIVDEIKAEGGYKLIEKNSTNGFHEQAFRDCLEKNGKSRFIVVGDCTDICVLQFCLSLKTYFTQKNMRSEIIIPLNCVETYDAPYHEAGFMSLAAYKILKDSGIEFVSEII
ncbi:MAG: cysteine hydrolase [Ruminococcus sp.]|nr:cysteine hydrolase [Ruminococcus sp.]MCM1382336.1 cysteine hydrolase [Muribaculaceae bacterium]MCM1480918.1 cysteine hydrolase [Muribaculaceae bacterium]